MPLFTAGLAAAGATAGAGVIGDVLGLFGQQQTNQANAQQAALNRQFQAQQVQQQEAFQANQAATAVQTRARDLKAAGLNPTLAAGSPAQAMTGSAAQGAQATFQNPSAQFSNLGQITASAVQAGSQAEVNAAQAKNLNYQALLASSRLPYAGQEAQQTVSNLRDMGNQIRQQASLLGAQFDNTVENTVGKMQDNQFQRENWDVALKTQLYNSMAKQYGLAPLEADSDFYKSWMGKWAVIAQQLGVPASQTLNNTTGAAANLIGPIIEVLSKLTPLGQLSKVAPQIYRQIITQGRNPSGASMGGPPPGVQIPTLQPPAQ